MEELSAFPGVTRRDFLKICGGLAALIGLGQAGAAEVAQALERGRQAPQRRLVRLPGVPRVLGEPAAEPHARSRRTLILQQISLNYHEAVMAPAGNDAEKSFDDTLAAATSTG